MIFTEMQQNESNSSKYVNQVSHIGFIEMHRPNEGHVVPYTYIML